jgi:CHAD domain-containing protein
MGRDMTLGAVLQGELALRLSELRQQGPRVRKGADDAVHKTRVAVRRLRSVLATYRSVLQPGTTNDLRDELRWIGRELSPARDAEVLAARLEQLLREEPPDLLTGPVDRRVATEMAHRHRDGRKQALGALDSDRWGRLLDRLGSFVEAPPFAEAAHLDARRHLPDLLGGELDRIRRRARAVDDPGAAHPDEALHDVRKAAKRLRYAADSAVPVLGRPAELLGADARTLQDLLGEHQDTAVARRTLRDLGLSARPAHETGFTLGRFHALEQARAQRLLDDYPAALRRLTEQRIETCTEPSRVVPHS